MSTPLHSLRLSRIFAVVLASMGLTALAVSQGEATRMRRLEAVERFVDSTGAQAMDEFIASHLAPTYAQSIPAAELRRLLGELRRCCGNPGGIGIEPSPGGAAMMFETHVGMFDLAIDLEASAPYRITGLRLTEHEAEPAIELSWEGYVEALEDAEARGAFSGAVLVVRDGQVVHDRGYGFADQARTVKNTTDTLFAIGSTPIDFTKAAILMLRERGALTMEDRITEWFEDLPADKRGITVGQLMHGRSGLRNFHGDPAVDEDLDLSPLGRGEAMRRIFAAPLLFEPGSRSAHSHSAFGVLAAIVEIVTGRTYGEFLREEICKPAGMKDTGLYPLSRTVPERRVAAGLDRTALGKPSTPRNWGETSWLVMGSGGMVSTVNDLRRFHGALHAGKLFARSALPAMRVGGVLEGGNDRGFCCAMTEDADTFAIICCNSHRKHGDETSRLAAAVCRMTLPSPSPASFTNPFTFGVVLQIRGEEPTLIQQVVAGSAAEAAGLRAGMAVHAVGGEEDVEQFLDVLNAAGRSGKTVPFLVGAPGEEPATIEVQPRRR